MQKVSCENGHFYDAERFQACPICGVENYTNVEQDKPVGVERLPSTVPLFSPEDCDEASEDISEDFLDTDRLEATTRLSPEDEARLRAAIMGEQEGGEGDGADPSVPNQEPEPDKTEAPGLSLSEVIQATSAQGISSLPKTVAYYDFGKTIPPVAWIVCVKGCYQGRAFMCQTGKNRLGREKEMEICLYEDPLIARDTHAAIIYEPKRRQFFLQTGSGDGLVYRNDELVFSHEELHIYDKISLGKLEFVFLPLCGEQFTWDDYITGE